MASKNCALCGIGAELTSRTYRHDNQTWLAIVCQVCNADEAMYEADMSPRDKAVHHFWLERMIRQRHVTPVH